MRVKEWLRHCPKKIEQEQKRKANLDQMENSNEEDNETAETLRLNVIIRDFDYEYTVFKLNSLFFICSLFINYLH